MRRILAALGVGLAVWATAPTLQAGGWDDFWYNFHRDYQRNKMWPHPFSECDQAAVGAPFCVMAANGWQRQNLIGENYFDEDSKKLSIAGLNRVKEILVETQPEHRMIFVQRDLSSTVTATRLDAVQQAVASLSIEGPMPEVLLSNMRPEGRSAEIVSKEQSLYIKSIPNPRLSAAGSSSSSTSSSTTSSTSGGPGGS